MPTHLEVLYSKLLYCTALFSRKKIVPAGTNHACTVHQNENSCLLEKTNQYWYICLKLKTLIMGHMICIFRDGLRPDQVLTLGGLKVLLAAQFVSRFNLSVCLCMIVWRSSRIEGKEGRPYSTVPEKFLLPHTPLKGGGTSSHAAPESLLFQRQD